MLINAIERSMLAVQMTRLIRAGERSKKGLKRSVGIADEDIVMMTQEGGLL